MIKFRIVDFKKDFSDDDACLDWLKNKFYPLGIPCPVCKKVTKHHKVSRRRCYACDNCGNQVYPAAGTIFHKSTTSLKTWFKAIDKISNSNCKLSAKEIQKEYGLNYKTACRMTNKIKEFLNENNTVQAGQIETEKANMPGSEMDIQKIQLLEKVNQTRKTLKRENGVRQNFNKFEKPATSSLANIETISSPSIEIPKYSGFDHTLNDNNKEQILNEFYQKRDRTARLLKVQMLLCQYPNGLNIDEIASRCSISKRTAYRDLKVLESELGVPVWEEGSRRGIADGFFLPPITLNLPEATIVFLAARLIQNYSHLNNPSLASTFMKLNTVVPMPLKREIQHTLEHLEKQPKDTRKINNFDILIQAWLTQHKVKILCQYIDEDKPNERIIDPYFIEPSIIGSSSYVIAYCHLRKTICAFKLERIIGEVIIQNDKFEIPPNFNTIDYLGAAWGIQTDKEIQTVKLRFTPKISRVVAEFNVHPTQINEVKPDGSMVMTLKVRDNIHFRNWIIAWADQVEVLEPKSLRKQIRSVAQSLMKIYPESE